MWGNAPIEIGSDILGGLSSQSLNLTPNVLNDTAAGELYPRIVSLRGQGPLGNLVTRDLKQGLTLIPLTGTDIAGLTGGLKMYAARQADGGTRSPGATHTQYTIVKGMIVPRTLSCAHQDEADFNADILITWDGTNAPVVVAHNAALPAAPLDTAFSIGPVRIGGKDIQRIRNVSIDFNLQASTEGADSDIWDRQGRIAVIQPTILLEGIDLEWFSDSMIPLTGQAGIHTDTEIWFRQRAAGGTYEADTALKHVKITAAGLAQIEQASNVTEPDLATANLRMTCSYDGTNPPLVIAVDQQISAP